MQSYFISVPYMKIVNSAWGSDKSLEKYRWLLSSGIWWKPWRWRQLIPPKRQQTSSRQRGIIFQNTVIFKTDGCFINSQCSSVAPTVLLCVVQHHSQVRWAVWQVGEGELLSHQLSQKPHEDHPCLAVRVLQLLRMEKTRKIPWRI